MALPLIYHSSANSVAGVRPRQYGQTQRHDTRAHQIPLVATAVGVLEPSRGISLFTVRKKKRGEEIHH